MKKIISRLDFLIHFIFFLFLYPFGIVKYAKKKPWIISERHNDARDNGYFFFKYLTKEHPEINSYYLIDLDSPDIDKVKSLGNVVKYGSIKHWLLFIAAEARCSTHLGAIAPNKWIGRYFELHKCWRGVNIFLQHGVIKEYLDMAIYKENHVDAFICGAKPEYDFLVKEYSAPEGTFVYTGLARFDNLHDIKTKRQILFMPTWRLYLSGLSKEEFINTDYCKYWNQILQSKELDKLLIDNDIELIFYPHYSSQPYLDCFKTVSNKMVIASFDKFDVSTLLKESSLLITDYSSIFFDFAYMHKPEIYYQFDQTDYFNKHYHRGYFYHEQDGFGPVVYDVNGLLKEITKVINNNFVNEQVYIDRTDRFFPLYDTHNSERIYQTILEKLKK